MMNMHLEKLKMSTANLYSTLVQRYERLVKGQEGRSESLRTYFDNGILLKAHTATKHKYE